MDQLIAEFGTNRARDRCNLVLKAAEARQHNQQQGTQVGSNTNHYTSTKPALPGDRETTQTAAAQVGTTAIARISHLFYCSNESEKKAATPRYDTVRSAIFSWIPSTTFAWRSPIRKNKMNEAHQFSALVYMYVCHKKSSVKDEGGGWGWGGCTQFEHGRSRMTTDPRIPTMPGRSTSGFHQPGRHGLHQARSAVRCSASRNKSELHPSKNRS